MAPIISLVSSHSILDDSTTFKSRRNVLILRISRSDIPPAHERKLLDFLAPYDLPDNFRQLSRNRGTIVGNWGMGGFQWKSVSCPFNFLLLLLGRPVLSRMIAIEHTRHAARSHCRSDVYLANHAQKPMTPHSVPTEWPAKATCDCTSKPWLPIRGLRVEWAPLLTKCQIGIQQFPNRPYLPRITVRRHGLCSWNSS